VLDIDLIKRTICKGSNDEEFALFVNQCKRTGLDPFAKQIHAVKRWDNSQKREVMQVQIGIDGFRLIADRTERYVPGRAPEFDHDADGRLVSATAYVKVWRRDTWHEVPATAVYAEYVQTTRDGNPNAMWAKMPHSQLAKCAEALALRKAFPAELSGLYTPDEMGQADNAPTVTTQPTATTEDHGEYVPEPQEAPPAPPNPATPRSFHDSLVEGCKAAYRTAEVTPTVDGIAMALGIHDGTAKTFFNERGKFVPSLLTADQLFRVTFFAAHGNPAQVSAEEVAAALKGLEELFNASQEAAA
jgi:phage recombination protein Bet